MTQVSWLALYSVAVLGAAVIGGGLPLVGRPDHGRLQLYLSFSAGTMIGAATFHMIHRAVRMCDSELLFGAALALGLVLPFCIDRFLSPHSHEVEEDHGREPPDRDHRGATPAGHVHGATCAEDPDHSVAPALAGWMAVAGITLHTFLNGIALAGAVRVDPVATAFPGLAVFLAVVLHKPADALALSVVLRRKGISQVVVMSIQIGFALMVPLGAFAFLLSSGAVSRTVETSITGVALAFSAGAFLYLALSDLLPEVQFHRHDRVKLSLALLIAVGLMGLISQIEGLAPSPHGHEPGQHGHR
ncbi:MAG: ZIP family metal transporter [Candidatus Riflebacteria bacterium]|nr:ZIP family metal transporter [Candidatus Riflebacteria bacterium]